MRQEGTSRTRWDMAQSRLRAPTTLFCGSDNIAWLCRKGTLSPRGSNLPFMNDQVLVILSPIPPSPIPSTSSPLKTTTMQDPQTDLPTHILPSLLTTNPQTLSLTIDTYFTLDAAFHHPFLILNGRHRIKALYQTWSKINSSFPSIVVNDICKERSFPFFFRANRTQTRRKSNKKSKSLF